MAERTATAVVRMCRREAAAADATEQQMLETASRTAPQVRATARRKHAAACGR